MKMTIERNNVARTSVKQVAALLKRAPLLPSTVNLDLGGGKYDDGTAYLAERGVKSMVYDPFNRTEEHNQAVMAAVDAGVDTVTLANVLNVIESSAIRQMVLMQAREALKIGGVIYIDVYEGNRSGVGARTKLDTWQENRPMASYLHEVHAVFPGARMVRGYIVAAKMEG